MISMKHLPLCTACAEHLAWELRWDADLGEVQINLTEGHQVGTFSFSALLTPDTRESSTYITFQGKVPHWWARCAWGHPTFSHCCCPWGSEQQRGLGSRQVHPEEQGPPHVRKTQNFAANSRVFKHFYCGPTSSFKKKS